MPIYMNYDGIAGDATAEGHEERIELNSFQWGSAGTFPRLPAVQPTGNRPPPRSARLWSPRIPTRPCRNSYRRACKGRQEGED